MKNHILSKSIKSGEIIRQVFVSRTILFHHNADKLEYNSKVKEVITEDGRIYKTLFGDKMLKLTKKGWSSGYKSGSSYHFY
jgi:hypothetical protein